LARLGKNKEESVRFFRQICPKAETGGKHTGKWRQMAHSWQADTNKMK